MNKEKLQFFIATILLFAIYFGYIPYELVQFSNQLGLSTYTSMFLIIIGFFMMMVGVLTYFVTTKTFFKVAGNTPLITHPTKNVMKTSLYSKTRNPMYIGHLILIFGEFLVTGSLFIIGYWIFTAILLHLLVVLYEEPLTKKRLGNSYDKYLREVPRWL